VVRELYYLFWGSEENFMVGGNVVPVSWNLDDWKNKLFFGENLSVMKTFPNEFVDLVYLDPPFNSNKNYNVIFQSEDTHEDSEAQIRAFDDTWHWTTRTEEELQWIVTNSSAGSELIDLVTGYVKALGKNDATAYLVMLTARIIELHRVMKPTASFYLHCDPTMSHYIKTLLDQLFDIRNFRNEIIWKRTTGAHNDGNRYGRIHDSILFYTKSSDYTWNRVRAPYSDKYLKMFSMKDERGVFKAENLMAPGGRGPRYEWNGVTRNWRVTKENMEELQKAGLLYYTKSGMPKRKYYLEDAEGMLPQDIWTDIVPLSGAAKERLGYQTQKPLALLERMIQSSSNEGGIVLDPFCGCGTAVDAAQALNRKWIGVDITHLAITLIKFRLKEKYGSQCEYEVHGEPVDVGSAKELAQIDRMNFQIWACGLIGAKPREKKGADKGIDGYLFFYEDAKNFSKALVQVKSGRVKSGDIRDLKGTIQREKVPMGIFITLEPFTRDMKEEAATAGFYVNSFTGSKHPAIQIYTIEELLGGKRLNVPLTKPYHKQSTPLNKSDKERQNKLF